MPDETFAFDVFLSHNSKDKPAVRRIAEALRDRRGLKVWLDEWELPPGVPWQDELESIIRTVRSAAVLVGKDGLGPWEVPEMRGCLSEMVRRKIRVIPVLLPDAPAKPDLPMFLAQNTWVDLRGGITEEGLDRLQWGITGKKPVPKPVVPTAPVPPHLHNLPFSSLGDLLKGRDEELRKLQEGQATAITQAETIYGLGGIGKTRLAVEYAWRSGHFFGTTFFVVAESPEALRSNLANLARPDLLNLPEYKAAAQEESVAAVLRWLRENDRWLLILDNVDTKEAEQAVVKMVPSLSAGRVLITSRIRDWPATIRRQQIEILSLDEAQRFILDRTAKDRAPADDDPDQALRLAEELGNLPLALEQAAAYIVQRQMSLSEYLKEWEKEHETVLAWYDKSVMQYPASVAVTWQKTFQQLSPTAAAILRLTAHLAPDPIPSKMFEDGTEIVKEATAALCGEIRQHISSRPIKYAISELAAYSMIARDGENFVVHRLVLDVLRSTIPKKQRLDWIEWTFRLIDKFSPRHPNDVRAWPVWNLLRPHVVLVLRYAESSGLTMTTDRLMNQLGLFLYGKGLYGEAESLMRRALELTEERFGLQHPNVAVKLSNLATLLMDTKRLSQAEPLMRRALKISDDYEHDTGQPHPNMTSLQNNLSRLFYEIGRFSEAEPLIRSALQDDERTWGPMHPLVATRLSNLAQLFKATGRSEEAEELMRRALKIDESSLGLEHPNVAIRLHNLAFLLWDTDRILEAEDLMLQALKTFQRSLGQEHSRTRNTQLSLDRIRQQIAYNSRHERPPNTR